ncbi:MAG TPA: long-chain-fatty-acid--CoA ligase [Rhodanobacter sp.]|nr:long-chain-fatty-acid--CoA ligase [Rhodanobacter sp.]
MNLEYWPPGLPQSLRLPETSLHYNLEVAAARYPQHPAIIYYDSVLSYAELKQQVDALAGWLQACGVGKGDRVALYLQNSPQFVIAYHAVLRADAVVVPINPMNLAAEVSHIVADSGAKLAVFDQALAPAIVSLLDDGRLQHALAVSYADYLTVPTDLPLPECVSAPRQAIAGTTAWMDALAAQLAPAAHTAGAADLAIIPYTSGTTGEPKGCMHTHRSVMQNTVGSAEWCRMAKDAVVLVCLPMFHVTGLQTGVNTPVWLGATMVVMTRWDKRCAAMLIARHGVTAWTAIPTMLIDFLNQPDLDPHELASLNLLTGGGAAMPRAVAEKIQALWGIPYVEGYGLSETMAPTHTNPAHRPKPQCLGLPVCNTHAMVVDPLTLAPLPVGEVGEVLVNGPQVFQGYWGNPAATAAAFVEVEGVRYFRTGDLARVDEEGYFFMVDRLKRMINASGYKVWPAEVETILYGHPAVLEACVIGYVDAHRGESVKAFVVLRAGQQLDESGLIAWAREHMAAYKAPHVVEFVQQLPKSGTGKVMWRALQEREVAG